MLSIKNIKKIISEHMSALPTDPKVSVSLYEKLENVVKNRQPVTPFFPVETIAPNTREFIYIFIHALLFLVVFHLLLKCRTVAGTLKTFLVVVLWWIFRAYVTAIMRSGDLFNETLEYLKVSCTVVTLDYSKPSVEKAQLCLDATKLLIDGLDELRSNLFQEECFRFLPAWADSTYMQILSVICLVIFMWVGLSYAFSVSSNAFVKKTGRKYVVLDSDNEGDD